jgi:hypothetical protein
MCPNTLTGRFSTSLVRYPAGPIQKLAKGHQKRCERGCTHICVAPLQGTHDSSICNHMFKLSKDKRKEKSSWITSKATHHLKNCHSTLEYGKVYTAKESSAAGTKISAMFSHSHGRGPRKAAHNFDDYVANPIDTCTRSMAAWYSMSTATSKYRSGHSKTSTSMR